MPIPSCCRFGLLLLPLTWPIDAMARTPSQSMVRDGINPHPERQTKSKRCVSSAVRVEAARRKAAAGSRQTQSTRRRLDVKHSKTLPDEKP